MKRRVKTFWSKNLLIIEEAINDFLKDENINVLDISIRNTESSYYAYIYYQEEGNELV